VKVNGIKTLQTEVALKAIRPVSGLGPRYGSGINQNRKDQIQCGLCCSQCSAQTFGPLLSTV